MKENIITTYMRFKVECLKKYSIIIGSNLIDIKISDDYFNRYLNTYINTAYYHVLGTLDFTKDTKFNQTTINKELEGMYEEIMYDIDNSDLIESSDMYETRKKQAKISYHLSLFMSYFNKIEFSLADDFSNFIDKLNLCLEDNKRIKELFDDSIYAGLYEEVRKNLNKEEKFFNNLNDLDFSLVYKKYVSTNNYLIKLDHTIKRLKRNYKQTMVDKVYDFDNVTLHRVKTMINLLSIDILKKILSREKPDTYFINFREICFSSKKIFEDIIQLMDNPLIRNKLIILMDNSSYNIHRTMFNNYIDYTYGVIIDMSRISDVEKKLDSLSNDKLIKYIIVDKVKNKDYDFIKKYEVDESKELFFNRLKVD